MTTIDVVIPSFRRPEDVRRCLKSLSAQTLAPDRIVVIARNDDNKTIRGAQSLGAEVVLVDRPGQVAALNQALPVVECADIVAIFDDDVIVGPNWLSGVAATFSEHPELGGVCGRERLVSDGVPITGTTTRPIGTISWFGRATGLFHLAEGTTRDVHYLKGCAMAYRGSAIQGLRFDERFWGSGAQPFNDTAFSLAVFRRGWKMRWLDSVGVDHIHGARGGVLPRQSTGPTAVQVHNETVTILDHVPPLQRPVAVAWLLLVGSVECPGLLQLIRAIPTRRWSVIPWSRAALHGRCAGLWTWWAHREDRPR